MNTTKTANCPAVCGPIPKRRVLRGVATLLVGIENDLWKKKPWVLGKVAFLGPASGNTQERLRMPKARPFTPLKTPKTKSPRVWLKTLTAGVWGWRASRVEVPGGGGKKAKVKDPRGKAEFT